MRSVAARSKSSREPKLKALLIDSGGTEYACLKDILANLSEEPISLERLEHQAWVEKSLRTQSYDLYLIDIDEIDLSDTHIRSLLSNAAQPVIFLTEANDGTHVLNGAVDFLLKSELTPRAVERSIRYVLEIGRAKHTVAALRESETRSKALLEHLAEGVNFCAPDETLMYVNSSLARMTGYTQEEMIGKKTYDLIIPPENWSLVKKRVDQRLKGLSEEYDLELRRKDGTKFWAHVSASPIRDSAGEVIASVAIINDITEARENLLALKESESRYRVLVDELRQQKQVHQVIFDSVPAFIWFKDRHNKVLRVNKPAAGSIGKDVSQMEGQSTYELYPDEAEKYFKDDREVIETGKPKLGIIEQLQTAEGNKIWVQTDKVPYYDENGQIVGVIVFAVDVTERFRAEESLRVVVEGTASETADNFFRALPYHLSKSLGTQYAFIGTFEDSTKESIRTLAVWWVDHYVENFTYKIAGTPSETVINKSLRCYSINALNLFPTDKHLVMTGGQGYMGAPIFDSNGNPLGVLAVWDDKPIEDTPSARSVLTVFAARAGAELERLQAEQETIKLQRHLMQSQKMEAIGQLAAGVAHDLNNALGAVVGHLQLMKSDPELHGELAQSVDIALSGCERASSLIEQLLGFSRQGKYNLTAVSVQRAVSDTIHFLGRVIGKNIQIVQEYPPEDLYILADEGQVQQTLVNLIINAKQAMPDGGTIAFSYESRRILSPERYNPRAKAGSYVILSVRDTGIGIDPALTDKIFEPFFTTKTSQSGTGLGLSMVYGIMQNHGGWVEVESTVGKGTTFTLYFPEHVRHAEEQSKREQQHMETGSGTVLVVDDEVILVDLARRFLENAGLTVRGYHSAEEAISWYQKNHNSVNHIILDMKMPKADGAYCFHEFRKINPRARIVILSGYIHDQAVQDLLNQGAAAFFQKPLRYPDLVEWVLNDKAGATEEVTA